MKRKKIMVGSVKYMSIFNVIARLVGARAL